MAPKRPRDNDSEDVKYEQVCKRRRMLALKVRRKGITAEPDKPTLTVRVAKRPRRDSDSDSEDPTNGSSLKRFKVFPGTSKVATEYMKEAEVKNTRTVFVPMAINTDKVKSLIKHHMKRYSRFNPVKTCQKPARSQEAPAISLSEVESMCLKAMKEKEEQLKMEYEGVLSSRMVEMYESFIKFNNDVMRVDPGADLSSYLS